MNVTVNGRKSPYRTVTFDPSRNEVLLIEQRLLPHRFEIFHARNFKETAAAIRDMNQVDAISRIRKPTLVIVGDHDPSTPAPHGELIANHIAGAKLLRLPTAHLSNIEAAPAFNDALLEFLRNP